MVTTYCYLLISNTQRFHVDIQQKDEEAFNNNLHSKLKSWNFFVTFFFTFLLAMVTLIWMLSSVLLQLLQKMQNIKLLYSTGIFLYSLKTSENLCLYLLKTFSDHFRGYKIVFLIFPGGMERNKRSEMA